MKSGVLPTRNGGLKRPPCPGVPQGPAQHISINLSYCFFFFFLFCLFLSDLASLVAQLVKNPCVMWETWIQSLGWEDPLEKGKPTHCSILAWRIPWTVQSVGLQRVRHDGDFMIFTVSLGFVCFSFSNSCRWWVRLFIWNFCCFLEKTCIIFLLVIFLHSIDFIKLCLIVTSLDIVYDFLFDGIVGPLVF